MAFDFSTLNLQVIQPVAKEGSTKVEHPFRVTHNGFAIQPTKGWTKKGQKKVFSENPNDYKWDYCWFGIYDESNYIAGFSMDNAKFLELVQKGKLPEGMAVAFKQFCDANPGLVQVKG